MKSNKEWIDYLELKEQRPEQFVQSPVYTIEFDEDAVENFEKETGKRIGVVYRSLFNLLVVDLIKRGDGDYYTYERLFPAVQKGAVVVLTKQGENFVLLRQFRHSLREFQYAFPRGFGEKGIEAENNVRKEIEEELGAVTLHPEYLGEVVADSGMSGSKVSVYLCEIGEIKIKKGNEGISECVVMSEADIKLWIRSGKINDGFSLAALGLYLMR